MKLIWQLLRQHVSVLQLAGFLVTNLVGVAIVLTAVQLYRDVTPALQAPDSFLDNDFIILTKEVEGAGIGKTSFTQTELAELAEQPFTEALGEFTPARYSVMGGISLAGIGMRTYLFFESVPDRFLDVRSDEWGFEEGSEFVPIILPRNYLNLYNFGFASTRGLPQVSEDLVRGITLDLDLSGRGQFRNLKGRVVAFSNRLNTILVPEEFIRWSNRRFADKPAADPSRIILEVRNAADDRIHEYLALHRYQIMIITGCAYIFAWFITAKQLPQLLIQVMNTFITSKTAFLIFLNIALFLVGMFMESFSAIIVLMPILFPVATAYGIDPIHFGVIVCINLAIGYVTPPYGATLFVACGLTGKSVREVFPFVIPTILAMLVVLIIVTYLPQTYLWLPQLMG